MDQLHLESIAHERERERAVLHLAGRARAAQRPARGATVGARIRVLLSRFGPRRLVSAPGREQGLAE